MGPQDKDALPKTDSPRSRQVAQDEFPKQAALPKIINLIYNSSQDN